MNQNVIGGVGEFLSSMKKLDVIYDQKRGSGVVFHLLGAMKEYGKVGYTAIGRSKEESESFYLKAKNSL